MPFDRQSDSLFERVLCPALEQAGMRAVRADSVLDQHSVMRDVVEGIADASLVVADISQVNANVYYELGLAHALRRPTILLTQDLSKMPFDLKGYRVLVYSAMFEAVGELSDRLTEIASEHLAGRVRFGSPITDYLDASAMTKWDQAVSSSHAELEAGAESEYIDWLADLQDADEKLGELLTEIATATEQIGDQMAARAAQVEQTPDSEIAPLAREAARDLSEYADILEHINRGLSAEAQRFVAAGLNLAEWFRDPAQEDGEGREEFRSSAETLLGALSEGREGLDEYRAVIGGLRGITFDLNRASSRAARHLDDMFEVIDNIVAFCERSIAIVPPGVDETRPEQHDG